MWCCGVMGYFSCAGGFLCRRYGVSLKLLFCCCSLTASPRLNTRCQAQGDTLTWCYPISRGARTRPCCAPGRPVAGGRETSRKASSAADDAGPPCVSHGSTFTCSLQPSSFTSHQVESKSQPIVRSSVCCCRRAAGGKTVLALTLVVPMTTMTWRRTFTLREIRSFSCSNSTKSFRDTPLFLV